MASGQDKEELQKVVEELSKLTIPKGLEELRLARPAGTPMQMLLRSALRNDFDVKISIQFAYPYNGL